MADAVAIGAGPIGAVEGEEPGRQFLHHGAVDRTGEVFRIEPFPLHPLGQGLVGLGHHLHQSQAIAPFQGRAQGIGEPFLDAFAGHQPVYHHLNVVGVVLIEFNVVGEFAHFAIDPHPGKALGHQAAQ